MNRIFGMVALGIFQIILAGASAGIAGVDLAVKESVFSNHGILFLLALISLMGGLLALFLAHLSVPQRDSLSGVSEETRKDLARFKEQGNFNQQGDNQHG